ncbi:hypothetical protein PIB30_043037 [Stylosanthes scabra]|uniref:Uncharacterized protein n=1 Tax=Stylosanthes scabra TaxID=79078 RepID=A0ABU6YE86_9FABA|nr:hypothetical protein [Stylosanthes scabra]
MRGIGGPLLCIGDLLSDVGEEGDATVVASPMAEYRHHDNLSSRSPSSNCLSDLDGASHVPDLTKLFQENYDHLVSALAGTDHSWTSLTLKKIVKRADSAIAAAREVHVIMDNNNGTMGGSSSTTSRA